MRLQHALTHNLRRLRTRYPFLRRISLATTFLTLLWLYTLQWGEQNTFESHIDACHWSSWEQWPKNAVPHRMVLIADPQLVDPHTYPGRPWPLSKLTEIYTDRYMARNYRLINDLLDPDSIVFLGDLFDGGREWAPEKAKALTRGQEALLGALGVVRVKNDGEVILRPASEEETFRPGEEGRWSRWGHGQWMKDFRRFSKIFFEPGQLYPYQGRQLLPTYEVDAGRIDLGDGARSGSLKEYVTMGGKQRRVLASLPGNHDLGFGPGVQIAIRDRFQAHFGESNRIDILGNHTFVSLDAPSLAAHSYFKDDGWETDVEQIAYEPLWRDSVAFLKGIRTWASKGVAEALEAYFPLQDHPTRFRHEVVEPLEMGASSVEDTASTLQPKPAKPNMPVVLLTHVPLYRSQETECGAQREKSNAIPIRMGYQYQNTLTPTLSREIVEHVVSSAGEIALAFSGDDHDYCDVVHSYNVDAQLTHVREITVKSFSWAMGVQRPGIVMASLWNPVDAQGRSLRSGDAARGTVQTHLCLLPDQLSIFVKYGVLLAVTLLVLVLDTIYATYLGDIHNGDDASLSQLRMLLPRFRPTQLNGNGAMKTKPNAYSSRPPVSSKNPKRQRGTSTSHSRNNSILNGAANGGGVQRTVHARNKSITSPDLSNGGMGGGLIEKAGYFPAVRWVDPGEDSDPEDSYARRDASHEEDEEAKLGGKLKSGGGQAKWKWRRRLGCMEKLRRPVEVFLVKFALVGAAALVWYILLLRGG